MISLRCALALGCQAALLTSGRAVFQLVLIVAGSLLAQALRGTRSHPKGRVEGLAFGDNGPHDME